jgi:hypothetical protein
MDAAVAADSTPTLVNEPRAAVGVDKSPARAVLDEATRRRLAVEIGCDPRSLAKLLRGEEVRGLAGHRIRAGLIERGLLAP